MPPADVFDAEQEYHVLLDMPGAAEDHLEVEVGPVPGTLAIRAKARPGEEAGAGQPLRVERCAGAGAMSYQRIVPVAPDADVDEAEYELQDGVLRVIVPKKKPETAAGRKTTGGRRKTK